MNDLDDLATKLRLAYWGQPISSWKDTSAEIKDKWRNVARVAMKELYI